MKTTPTTSLLAALLLLVACSESDGSDPGGSGGTSAFGGAGGAGGTAGGGAGGASGSTATGGTAGTGGSGLGGTGGATGGSGGSAAGAAGAAGTGGAVIVDECDSTAECQAAYGAEATDCVNSQSDESWCDCGGAPCKDVVDGGTAGAGGTAGTGGTAGAGGTAGTGGTGGGTTIPSGTFLADQNDRIVFEVESVAGTAPPSPWAFLSAGPCATPASCEPLGSGFYQWKGATPCNNSAPGEGVMNIRFRVETAGRYRVVWRNLRDHRDGSCGSDRNNDSFMAFPTTQSDAKFQIPFKVYGGGEGTWNWSTTYDIHEEKERVCLDFSEGTQEMEIHGRSRDHAIDKVVLFRVDGTLADCRAAGTTGFDALPETGIQP